MELTQDIKGHPEANRRRVSLRAMLAIILGAGMVLLLTSTVVFGVAIQRRAIAPPELDVRFSRVHLVAYATHTPECAQFITSCPPELITLPTQDFYVIWMYTQSGQPGQLGGIYEIGTRMLTLPLRQP